MSVFGTKNLMNVFVAKDVAGTAIASITSDLLATMADGQVIAVGTPAGGGAEQVIPASSALGSYTYFRLVESQAGVLNYGPRIKVSDVYFAATKTYVAPVEQIYYVGYNGTSGSLDVSQANEFIFTIAYDHDDMMWSEQKLRNAYDYYSPAPTQQNLAMSMVSQINYKENLGSINGTGKMVIADMLAQGTATALDSTATLAVTNGSTTITASAAQTTNWAVGTVIRIGSGATATTDPVYVITSVASTTVATINMPYQGATNSAVATANIRTLSAITNWGFRVTGQPLTWSKDFFKFMKIKFHFDLKGFGATVYDRPGSLTQSATAPLSKESSKGIGSAYEVAEMESFAAGFEGALNRMVVPLPAGRTYADTTTPKTYDVIVFESADNSIGATNPVVSQAPMRVQQFVCVPASAAVRTKLASQLNTLLGASL